MPGAIVTLSNFVCEAQGIRVTMLEPFSYQAHGPAPSTLPVFRAFSRGAGFLPVCHRGARRPAPDCVCNRALEPLLSGLSSQEGALFGRKLWGGTALRSRARWRGCGTNEACQTCGAFLAVNDGLQGIESVKGGSRLVRKAATGRKSSGRAGQRFSNCGRRRAVRGLLCAGYQPRETKKMRWSGSSSTTF